ncbi:hypothetical protein [Paenibacillus spongiae]|uniref:Uncharacterized protein n=1 Tax=Paenibacillus spongiae TaxID=2909671 RepID=A0ABY5SA65_9BACL|nr:hypothetical protein [Paenibacillus spongiae]UVI29188.1 hypothetical protein L1F29_27755 [Paenibacillus spongiae]
MRIETGNAYSPLTRRTSAIPAPNLFEAALQKIEKEDDKQKDDKGKLVTAREGAYVRQYIVRADGSKILIRETKQAADDSTLSGHDPQAASVTPEAGHSGLSQNAKHMLHLVNLQVGAAVGFGLSYISMNGPSRSSAHAGLVHSLSR